MKIDLASILFTEVLEGMRNQSEVVILDFNQIDKNIPEHKNIKLFFLESLLNDRDPRLPENRQQFNNTFLQKSGKKYLIGRYGEDRIEMLRGSQIAAEGRTIHLGLDLFTEHLEPVSAPYEGVVVRAGYEKGSHTYGHYCILEHEIGDEKWYTFYGHLSSKLPTLGTIVQPGQHFADLGDYLNNENGGWSRHLHFQLVRELPSTDMTPIGYSTKNEFPINRERFPNPDDILRIFLVK